MLVALSDTDKVILNSYTNVVNGIAATYGCNTEVVLHSLDVENPSIIMIANGHVTGRSVGAPITDLALDKLRSGCDVSKPYLSRNNDGALLRSVTSVIKNGEGKAIGVLCTNTNLDAPLSSFFGELLPDVAPTISPENFAQSSHEMLNEALEQVRRDVVRDANVSARLRNKEIILRLSRKGVFNIKDSIQHTADALGVSVNVVYRHIRESK